MCPAKPPTPSGNLFFGEPLFRFLRELREHNDREWFQANKARFEAEVRGPVGAFILAAAEPLRRISPHYASGTMFRIFRDTRFSRDKTPYKTNVGIHFRHQDSSRDVHSPGFYLHLEPGSCFMGAGLWHPEAESLRRVRERILHHGEEWEALLAQGLEVEGDSLVRVPRGFDPESPFAAALKLKDFYTGTSLTERQVCARTFLGRFEESCRQSAPLAAFLSKALDLAW